MLTPLTIQATDPWWLPTIREEAADDDRFWDALYDIEPDAGDVDA